MRHSIRHAAALIAGLFTLLGLSLFAVASPAAAHGSEATLSVSVDSVLDTQASTPERRVVAVTLTATLSYRTDGHPISSDSISLFHADGLPLGPILMAEPGRYSGTFEMIAPADTTSLELRVESTEFDASSTIVAELPIFAPVATPTTVTETIAPPTSQTDDDATSTSASDSVGQADEPSDEQSDDESNGGALVIVAVVAAAATMTTLLIRRSKTAR